MAKFIALVLHHCKPEMLEAAIARIDHNGEQMAKIPGFLFRYRTVEKDAPNTIGTVTGWVDEASYDAWLAAKAKMPDLSPSPYESWKSTRHVVGRADVTADAHRPAANKG